ncbi:tRNA wybutosine-synthesizing protein 2 homolog [Bacillus rossius redtenbacheri]|uniref:tRNA wybutosine-synthesizing protein 2 homolog n=1 Tax=Bacillus rossius redtenbacheri TaxID=93214 RepID=UPI002FDDB3F5
MITFAITDIQNCQKFRKLAEDFNLYDDNHKCKRIDGRRVGVPLREGAVGGLATCEDDPSGYSLGGVSFRLEHHDDVRGRSRATAADSLRSSVQHVMKGRGLWSQELEEEVPRRWEKFGDLVVFSAQRHFVHERWAQAGDVLWDAVCAALKAKRVALRHHIQANDFRSPLLRLVRGESGWVEHRDNGILYGWDVTKSMFCAGNAPEKQRVAQLDCSGQTVVDMFAGIGYFTLPFLVHAKARCVHACEWSPHALHALRYNLERNKVTHKCVVHPGDCNKVCPSRVADRVNLGLLPSSRISWPVACGALKNSGGVLHIHECVPEHGETCSECATIIAGLPERGALLTRQFFSCNRLQDCSFLVSSGDRLPCGVVGRTVAWRWAGWRRWALHAAHSVCEMLPREEAPCWRVVVDGLHHVKSYAPHVDHLVLDLRCEPLHHAVS